MEWLLLFLILIGAGAALNSTPAYAQQPTPDPQLVNQMDKIAAGLYCPVCSNTPLNVCETQACEQWRQLIVDKLAAGQSEQQIRQYFVDQYGDRVLGAPPAEGFDLSAYLLPLFMLLAGVSILFFTMRKWLRPPGGAKSDIPEPMPNVAPEYAERIARELRDQE